MYHGKKLVLAVAVLTMVSCSDQPTPTQTVLTPQEAQLAKRQAPSTLLTNIDVNQVLANGSVLDGVLSITELGLVDGALVASGTLVGTVTGPLGAVTQFTQTFTDTALDLSGSGLGACDILNLDLGPIFLDLLGLQVDLSAINLDIVAQTGAGNLLGNLLCAVVGLLDGPGALAGLLNILDQINAILG